MIFFDLDETLFDYSGSVNRALAEYHERFRDELEMPIEELRDKWSELFQIYWTRYAAGELTREEQLLARIRGLNERCATFDEVTVADRGQYFTECYDANWSLFEDVIPTLERLQSDPKGIITNGMTEQQMRKIRRTGLLDHFEVCIVSEACGFWKPAREIFMHACEAGNTSPEQSLHIGDNVDADVFGCSAVGFRAVWLNRVGATAELPAGACEIQSLTEVLPLLSR